MFTHKDIENRTIFVVDCINHERRLKVNAGEFHLQEILADNKHKTLTKFPFQKLIALFVIGNISITTPLIDKCKKYGIAIIVVKPNLRPVFIWNNIAEANFLLRKRQYDFPITDLSIAETIIKNKILNQKSALLKTRKKDPLSTNAIKLCDSMIKEIDAIDDYNRLMGIEGIVANTYFSAYFQDLDWKGRHPRTKTDYINSILDIGYTILFNFVESFVRLFGFDVYIGVYHRLWFKRKSLICDLIEPFRCIIDHIVLIAINRKQFSEKDFLCSKNEWILKREKSMDYYRVFFDAIIPYKTDIFKYIQKYYRCFMGNKSINEYPIFKF